MRLRVYQIKLVPEHHEDFAYLRTKRFCALPEKETFVDAVKDNYIKVYDVKSDTVYTLNNVYRIFNISQPEDFHGHSLSVSDIVALDDDFYRCEPSGWKKIDFKGHD